MKYWLLIKKSLHLMFESHWLKGSWFVFSVIACNNLYPTTLRLTPNISGEWNIVPIDSTLNYIYLGTYYKIILFTGLSLEWMDDVLWHQFWCVILTHIGQTSPLFVILTQVPLVSNGQTINFLERSRIEKLKNLTPSISQ